MVLGYLNEGLSGCRPRESRSYPPLLSCPSRSAQVQAILGDVIDAVNHRVDPAEAQQTLDRLVEGRGGRAAARCEGDD
eukprot:6603600-Pyramimonas_sp.AAC.1